MIDRVIKWHRQVAVDFEKVFGDEVHLHVASAVYVRSADEDGAGTLSWIGNPPNTIDMIGHLIRTLAKDGMKHGDMTASEAGASLMAEIAKVASLADLTEYSVDQPVSEDDEDVSSGTESVIITEAP